MGCKDKTSSCHLIRFPDDGNIESTVSRRGETHRYTVHFTTLIVIEEHKKNKDKKHEEPELQLILKHWV